MKKQKRKLKKGVKKIIIIAAAILSLISIIKILEIIDNSNTEAYNTCINKLNDEAYCRKSVYGIY